MHHVSLFIWHHRNLFLFVGTPLLSALLSVVAQLGVYRHRKSHDTRQDSELAVIGLVEEARLLTLATSADRDQIIRALDGAIDLAFTRRLRKTEARIRALRKEVADSTRDTESAIGLARITRAAFERFFEKRLSWRARRSRSKMLEQSMSMDDYENVKRQADFVQMLSEGKAARHHVRAAEDGPSARR